jgi:hypothetical protein
MAISITRFYDIILERVIGELREDQILAFKFDIFVVLSNICAQIDLVISIKAGSDILIGV